MFLKRYIQESLQELHHVTWPTRRQAVRITIIVFLFMVASGLLLGVIDQLLTMGYRSLLVF
ncbi:MAG: preprotein translocase subunit SecE [Candidatus Peregrinibacteria bacterium]